MFFFANWKMYGSTSQLQKFASTVRKATNISILQNHQLVVCPPHPYLQQAVEAGLTVGAQDCAAHLEGSYTGDVSAKMLVDIGCTHVILGHSERRRNHDESVTTVAAKIKQAANQGLTPIICVGEPTRDYSHEQTLNFITHELDTMALATLPKPGFIAYEPVWAIGTGLVPEVSDIELITKKIKSYMGPAWQVIYGGSVRSNNIDQMHMIRTIDGFLIGSASVDASEMMRIISACQ